MRADLLATLLVAAIGNAEARRVPEELEQHKPLSIDDIPNLGMMITDLFQVL